MSYIADLADYLEAKFKDEMVAHGFHPSNIVQDEHFDIIQLKVDKTIEWEGNEITIPQLPRLEILTVALQNRAYIDQRTLEKDLVVVFLCYNKFDENLSQAMNARNMFDFLAIVQSKIYNLNTQKQLGLLNIKGFQMVEPEMFGSVEPIYMEGISSFSNDAHFHISLNDEEV